MTIQRQREYVDNVTIKIHPDGSSYVDSGAPGVGDVKGPASATDQAFARFDGITGKLIQNSPLTLDDTGAIGGGMGSVESVQAFGAALSFDARASNVHRLSGPITSDFTVAIANALAGDCGTIGLTQDGVGGWKITNVTCAGFTVVMTPESLTTINTDGFKLASASSLLTYQCVGTLCIISMAAAVPAAYG